MEHNEYNTFLKPELPFLLHYMIEGENRYDYNWFKSEDEMINVINEMCSLYGENFYIEDIIEIGSVREVKVEE